MFAIFTKHGYIMIYIYCINYCRVINISIGHHFRFIARIQTHYKMEAKGGTRHGHGLYRSPSNWSRPEHYFDVTQFEPTDARLVFPCFDQPDMKGNAMPY